MVVSLPKIFQFSPLPAPTYDSIIYRNALFFWDGEKRSFFFRKVGKEIYYHRKKLNDVITTTYYYIVPLLDYLTGCDPRCFDADHSLVSSFFLASFRVSSLYDVSFLTRLNAKTWTGLMGYFLKPPVILIDWLSVFRKKFKFSQAQRYPYLPMIRVYNLIRHSLFFLGWRKKRILNFLTGHRSDILLYLYGTLLFDRL